MHTLSLASVPPGVAAKQYGPMKLFPVPIKSGMHKLAVVSAPTEVHAALMPELETESRCRATRWEYRIILFFYIDREPLCKSALCIRALSMECY